MRFKQAEEQIRVASNKISFHNKKCVADTDDVSCAVVAISV